MDELIAAAAERYAEAHTTAFAASLGAAAAWTRENTTEPQMMSGLAEARLLEVLIVAGGARHVLEIGSGTGQHVVDLARHIPDVTWWPSDSRRASSPATRMAEGPISTPRRLAPRSSGTPITRMRRGGVNCAP